MEIDMLSKKFSLFALAVMMWGSVEAGEPGSDYCAENCANSIGGYNITINKDGSAMVETDPTIYENIMTSYLFFGKATPSDFVVAILFDEKNAL
jgi:hypothetical protein